MHAKKDLILNPNADSMSKYSSKNKRACNEQDVSIWKLLRNLTQGIKPMLPLLKSIITWLKSS